jgi:tetratricopeptide (TPR) repeat protein
LAIAIVLIAAAASVTLLPLWLLGRAEEQGVRCLDRVKAQGAGDPLGCVPAGVSLSWPSRMPWLRADAEILRAELETRAAELDYALATAITPDRDHRERAASRLLGLRYGLSPAEFTGKPLELLPGSFGLVAAYAAERDDKELRAWGLRAARAVAAMELLRQLARKGDAHEDWRLSLQRGAALCLLGEAEPGRRLLALADESHQRSSEHGDGSDRARLAMIACSDETPDRTARSADDPVDPANVRPAARPALIALLASLGREGADERARAWLSDPSRSPSASVRLRLAPFAQRGLEQQTAAPMLALVTPAKGSSMAVPASALRSPWTLLLARSRGDHLLCDPSSARSTATDLEALAAALTAEEEEDEPPRLECSEQPCPATWALSEPALALKRAAAALWLDCALEWSARGKREDARAALARAGNLAPPQHRHALAVVHLALRAPDEALKTLEPALGSPSELPPVERVQLHLHQAMALRQSHRLQEAYEAAAIAFELAGKARRPAAPAARSDEPDPGAIVHDDRGPAVPAALRIDRTRAAAAWLWGAIALEVDREQDVLAQLPTASDAAATSDATTEGAGPTPGPLTRAALWLRLAAAAGSDEGQLRSLRWSLELPLPPGAPEELVLPAVMFVVGKAVPAASDLEVWLDRTFSDVHLRYPVTAMRARAEAARWRGDGAAAAKWEAHAQTLSSAVEDYRSAVLATLAGFY